MFRNLVTPGVDYETFSPELLPDSMRETGGIQYIGGDIPVKISDNVPERFRDIWVQHEIACNQGPNAGLAHWCCEVSEAEIRELVPAEQLSEYVRGRVAMLLAAVKTNLALINNKNYKGYYEQHPKKKESVLLAIAKLEGSIGFFQERFSGILSVS